jgi:PadR family transcriptional regulator PadR
MTKQTLRLLAVLLTDPRRDWYGLELMDFAALRSGTAYPILHRLQTDGWLTSTREQIDPAEAGRPQRRLYRLTASGERAARDAVEGRSVSMPTPFRAPRAHPRGAVA